MESKENIYIQKLLFFLPETQFNGKKKKNAPRPPCLLQWWEDATRDATGVVSHFKLGSSH